MSLPSCYSKDKTLIHLKNTTEKCFSIRIVKITHRFGYFFGSIPEKFTFRHQLYFFIFWPKRYISTESEIALSWSPMRLKILHWPSEFHNWSPVTGYGFASETKRTCTRNPASYANYKEFQQVNSTAATRRLIIPGHDRTSDRMRWCRSASSASLGHFSA